MRQRAMTALMGVLATLSACGGDGGSGGGLSGPGTGGTGPVTTAPTTTAGCSLRERQDWVAAQLREWYLFPETLPASLDPTPYPTVDEYIDALTATARAQRRDRYFTYLTSIKGEDAYYSSGDSGGYGFRLALDASGQLLVTEAFEGTPALAAGIDRGARITAIGTSTATLANVSTILNTTGVDGLNDALGPETLGTQRVFAFTDRSGDHVATVATANYDLLPVSTRYGAKIIEDGGRRVGYVNLRTFIDPAGPALRDAFASFRAAGITQVIVDLRYNGGGLVSVAQLMGDLMGANRSTSDVFSYTTFRPEKSAENDTRFFMPQTQSVAPDRIAFIGTGGTASASELVINAFQPYLHANAGLIGTNTYGKPVGQIALDNDACDDRLRVIAFATQNAARQGNYFDGLATTVEASCQADDDLSYQLGDPQEASTRAALNFLAGRSCTRITAAVNTATATAAGTKGLSTRRELLTPARPNTPQREVPGLY